MSIQPSSVHSDEYEVEKIIQRGRVNGVTHYLVKWKGYQMDQSTWQPITNLEHCQDMIIEFEAAIAEITKAKEEAEKEKKKTKDENSKEETSASSRKSINLEDIFQKNVKNESKAQFIVQDISPISQNQKEKTKEQKIKEILRMNGISTDNYSVDIQTKPVLNKNKRIREEFKDEQLEDIPRLMPQKKIKEDSLDCSFRDAKQIYNEAMQSPQIPNHYKYTMQNTLNAMKKGFDEAKDYSLEEKQLKNKSFEKMNQKSKEELVSQSSKQPASVKISNLAQTNEKYKTRSTTIKNDQKQIKELMNELQNTQKKSKVSISQYKQQNTQKKKRGCLPKKDIMINKMRSQEIQDNFEKTAPIHKSQKLLMSNRYARGLLLEQAAQTRNLISNLGKLLNLIEPCTQKIQPPPFSLIDFSSQPQVFKLLARLQLDNAGLSTAADIRSFIKLRYGWYVLYGKDGKVQKWADIAQIDSRIWKQTSKAIADEMDTQKDNITKITAS